MRVIIYYLNYKYYLKKKIIIVKKKYESKKQFHDDINSENIKNEEGEEEGEKELCSICFDLLTLSNLSCGHKFCNDVSSLFLFF